MTHFSPAVNGNGVEKETIFTNNTTNPFLQNGDSEKTSPTPNGNSNPFVGPPDNGGGGSGKYATIGRSNPFSKSSNPFLDTLASAATAAATTAGATTTTNGTANASEDASSKSTKKLNKIVSFRAARLIMFVLNLHCESRRSRHSALRSALANVFVARYFSAAGDSMTVGGGRGTVAWRVSVK